MFIYDVEIGNGCDVAREITYHAHYIDSDEGRYLFAWWSCNSGDYDEFKCPESDIPDINGEDDLEVWLRSYILEEFDNDKDRIIEAGFGNEFGYIGIDSI